MYAEPQSQVIKRGSAKGDLAGKREARNPGELEPQHSAEEKRLGLRGGLQGGCVHLSVLGALPRANTSVPNVGEFLQGTNGNKGQSHHDLERDEVWGQAELDKTPSSRVEAVAVHRQHWCCGYQCV